MAAPPPRRTRAAALALARELAQQAELEPAHFAELARRYSDDLSSRAVGGSLGGTVSVNLTPFPEVLDALSALAEGQVSRVIETEFGFHVLRRDVPPPEQSRSGARIVIQYREAPWLHQTLGVEPHALRSRQDAIALAYSIYRQAHDDPSRFAELVQRHSEHYDRVRAGDLGRWSLREPTHLARELDSLRALSVGEVAPPIDSPWGIQVLQRTADRERAEYAMHAIRVRFTPAHPDSKAAAWTRAREVAELLRRDPAQFTALQDRICCRAPERWFEGQEDLPSLSRGLDRLAVGEIASEPIEQIQAFVVPRRLDPKQLPARPSATSTLPAPDRPNVEFFVEVAQLSRRHFSALAQSFVERSSLGAARSGALIELHERELGTDAEQRINGYRSLLAGVEQLLGPSEYARYLEQHDTYFAGILLGPVRPPM